MKIGICGGGPAGLYFAILLKREDPTHEIEVYERNAPDDTFGPEDILHYAYAVFHSPTYRERYAEFLKIDFPRLPLTSDRELFKALAEMARNW